MGFPESGHSTLRLTSPKQRREAMLLRVRVESRVGRHIVHVHGPPPAPPDYPKWMRELFRGWAGRPAVHRITSSARTKIDSGMTTPIALAVLMFRTSLIVPACSTGSSAGLTPLSSRSTKYAARPNAATLSKP